MISCCGGDWTAVAVDEVLSIFFPKSSRAAQFFENAECSINSLLSRFATQVGRCSLATASTRGTHSGAQISGLICRENIDMRSETSRPYAFGNNCSASEPRAYVAWGFRKPGFMPEWTTSLSRSRLARCARTALSVRRNSSASSFTVLSLVHKRSRILPRVLLNNRSRQPICFIKSKIMRHQEKVKTMFD